MELLKVFLNGMIDLTFKKIIWPEALGPQNNQTTKHNTHTQYGQNQVKVSSRSLIYDMNKASEKELIGNWFSPI